jgi:hypothetical protein
MLHETPNANRFNLKRWHGRLPWLEGQLEPDPSGTNFSATPFMQ